MPVFATLKTNNRLQNHTEIKEPVVTTHCDTPDSITIADVQNSEDTRHLPINKVGIKDIRHPVRIRDRSGGEQHTIACFNMYVNSMQTVDS